MADVKICDRCGVQFTNKKHWFTFYPVRYVFGKTTYSRVFLTEQREIYKQHDLCSRCADDLGKFMKGEAVEAIKEDTDELN